MKSALTKAIFKTLVYADIFDYPLKKEEIWQFLIFKPKAQGFELKDMVKTVYSELSISQSRGYFFLTDRKKIIDLRQRREGWSREKLKKAQRVGRLLKIIPTIKMVGITGNLAMNNCEKDDDIDLLVISSAGTVWLTRFLSVSLLEISGWRRRPNQKKVKDKICLNMFLDESHLKIPPKEQDLYSAHEVVQLKPIWEKDGVYQNFLSANMWVGKYLPNAVAPKTTNDSTKSHEEKVSGTPRFHSWLFVFELLARKLQLWYMEKRRTTEVISDGLIRFHPHDARNWILEEFSRRLQRLGYELAKDR